MPDKLGAGIWAKSTMLSLAKMAIRTAGIFTVVCAIEATAHDPDISNAEKSFAVVLLPDTQLYCENYPDTYIAQTSWIRQRVNDDNIKFVIHLGDIVQTPTERSEWENANRAMRLLDGIVPYSMVPGNHDMEVNLRDTSLYNEFFAPARFANRKWYGGHMTAAKGKAD
jgi:predicted MPP superfamily phosphohydrolase